VHTSLTLLNHAVVLAGTSSGGGGKKSSIAPFLILLVIFVAVYMLFLRPARNRQRAAVTQKRQVEVGDEVTTTAGLIATVVAVEDDMLTLEVAPGVHCRYVPAAILRVNSDEPEPEEADDEATATPTDASTHEVIDLPSTPDEPSTTEHPDGSPTDH
jgi:preprotein translocase subunit YajC